MEMGIASLERDSGGGTRFTGCTGIRDFEFLGKLGEGTFGYALSRFVLNMVNHAAFHQRGLPGEVKKRWLHCRSEENTHAQ